ncbi:MAG: hypothetical protein MUC53_08385 [Candidatus Contendobacter sp.]|jgi:hypothetical protein|nr:hypothetical protein [Candidatus Contendobacter sp.]
MKPLRVNELREVANRRLVCAPLDCACEADCFRLAQALLQLLPEPLPETSDDPDVITDYAPDWGAA